MRTGSRNAGDFGREINRIWNHTKGDHRAKEALNLLCILRMTSYVLLLKEQHMPSLSTFVICKVHLERRILKEKVITEQSFFESQIICLSTMLSPKIKNN
jgi:hypothetical protein